jgi:hypothetical protein
MFRRLSHVKWDTDTMSTTKYQNATDSVMFERNDDETDSEITYNAVNIRHV